VSCAHGSAKCCDCDIEEQDTRNKVILAERVVLYTLGFDLQIDHPTQALIQMLLSFKEIVALQSEQLRSVAKTASDFVKDRLAALPSTVMNACRG
jgi:hypothetical protein